MRRLILCSVTVLASCATTTNVFEAGEPRIAHIVDPGQNTWTTKGHMAAMVTLKDIGQDRSGRVVCDIHEINSDGLKEQRSIMTLKGEIADGWPHHGPIEKLNWAVPMMPPEEIEESSQVFAVCGFEGSDRRITRVTALRARTIPDLRFSVASARSCKRDGPARADESTCVRVRHEHPSGLAAPGVSGFLVGLECRIGVGGETQFRRKILPVHQLGELELGPFNLKEGEHQVRCVTDFANHFPESDEENNLMVASISVLEPIDYSIPASLNITGVRSRTQQMGVEGGGQTWRYIELGVENTSARPMRELQVDCVIGDEVFSGVVPVDETAKGVIPISLFMDKIGPGEHKVACEVELHSPKKPGEEVRATLETVVTVDAN